MNLKPFAASLSVTAGLLFGCGAGRDGGQAGSSGESWTALGESAIVGSEGGRLRVSALVGAPYAELVIPPGALSAPTEITATSSEFQPPDAMRPVSAAYEFSPKDLEFAVPATLAIRADLGASNAVMYLVQADASGYCFEPVDGALRDGFVHAQVTHLGVAFIADPAM